MASWKNKLVGAIATGAIVAGLLPIGAFGAEALPVDGSISVTGLQDGDSAKYYQVVTQDDSNAWKLTAAVDADDDGKIDGSNFTIADLVITADPSAATTDKEVITAEIANAIAAALTTNGAAGADMDMTAGTASKSGVAAGLYMVSAVPGASNKNTVYKPVFVSADYNATDGTDTIALEKDETDYKGEPVVFKASNLDIDKEAAEVANLNTTGDTNPGGVGVGDTLEFTVTTPLVGYTRNYTNPVFKITDSLTAGLQLKADTIAVEVEGFVEGETIDEGTDYTIVPDGTSGWTVSFDKEFLYKVAGAPTVTITYQALVTSAAGAQVNQMDNDVKLNFSNEPTDETGAGELTDKTRHYTFDIDGNVLGGSEETGGDPDKKRTEEVQKVLVKTHEQVIPAEPATQYTGTNALKGAEFLLKDETTGKYIEWTNNVKSGTADAANTKTTITSDDYGSLVMKGLDEGTYTLTETKAPQGYTPDPNPHTIVISATYVDDADGNKILSSYTITIDGENTSTYTVELNSEDKPKELIGDEVGKITVDTEAVTTLISNTELGILPSTGGSGIYFYLVLGASVAGGAAYLLHKTKKQDELA